MTDKQWETFCGEMLRRLPALADLPAGTLDLWYTDLFAELDSGDTSQKLTEWWRAGKGPRSKFEAEAFGPQLAAAVSDIEYRRSEQQRLSRSGRPKSLSSTMENIGCTAAYEKNLELRRLYREENPCCTNDDVNYYVTVAAREKWESLIPDDKSETKEYDAESFAASFR